MRWGRDEREQVASERTDRAEFHAVSVRAVLTAIVCGAWVMLTGRAARAQQDAGAAVTNDASSPGITAATTSDASTASDASTTSESAFGPLAGEPEPYARTPDPTGWQYYAMPGARTLAPGDGALTVGSLLGWVALRYGAHRRVDVGVGVPFALVGVAADVRVAIVQERWWALSGWVMAQVPLHPGTSSAGDFFGFTFSGGGPWWAAGPLLSFWGDRGGAHFGVHLAQRALLGGLWTLAHATVDVRITDGVKALAQALLFAEAIPEGASTLSQRTLLGNSQPRIMPYATLGVRLYTRRSSVDLGALLIVGERSLLAYGPASVWPWLSATHAF